jgi:hypothetical protein
MAMPSNSSDTRSGRCVLRCQQRQTRDLLRPVGANASAIAPPSGCTQRPPELKLLADARFSRME